MKRCVKWVDATSLRLSSRFDLPSKIELANALLKDPGLENSWELELYCAQIASFNGFVEHERGRDVKRSRDDFVASFRSLVQSVSERGYDDHAEPVPVAEDGTPINGAHRVAACVATSRPVMIEVVGQAAPSFDYRYFRGRGLDEEHMDLIGRLSLRQRPELRIAVIWPAAGVNASSAHDVLEGLGDLVYVRPLRLSWRAMVNLVRVVYRDESWLGTYRNEFAGAQAKAAACYVTKGAEGTAAVAVFRPAPGLDLVQAKDAIRSKFGVGRSSIHICDTHDESLRVAEVAYHKAGRQYLAHAPLGAPIEEEVVNAMTTWAEGCNVALDECCVTGSTILSALGVRPGRDLDVLSSNVRAKETSQVGLHNAYVGYYGVKDAAAIISDPRLHFVHRGLKWATPELIIKLKRARNEPKDRRDIKLLRRRLAKDGATGGQDWGYALESAKARLVHRTKMLANRTLPDAVLRKLRKIRRSYYALRS